MHHTQHTHLCASHAARLIASQGERRVTMTPGGLGGNRTRDSLIKSQLPFHLVTSPYSARLSTSAPMVICYPVFCGLALTRPESLPFQCAHH